MYRFMLLMLVLVGLLSSGVQAQAPHPSTTTTPDNSALRHDPTPDASEQEPHQEMLRELEIKRAEETHKQNIERAKESAQLSVELSNAYDQQKTLHPSELKKLGRMEKLIHQLRSESGGGNDAEQLKDPPKDLPEALGRIVELADELRKCVEQTPRQVISVNLITQTNELLELIRLARSFDR